MSKNKVVLILADGMRPDSMELCGNAFLSELKAHSVYSMKTQTVMPSVTLPCHMSLFHSVTPARHGILTNTYVPQVRPIRGICEVLRAARKKNAFFYNWEELKDLSRPDSLAFAEFVSGHVYTYDEANPRLTDDAIAYIRKDAPDFTFLYLGLTDMVGHTSGWMSPEYLHAVSASLDCVEKVCRAVSDDTTVIVTADHGGHDRTHGSEMPEDMTIPLFFYKKNGVSADLGASCIIDIAPTVTALLGVDADEDWDGHTLTTVPGTQA